MGIFDANLLSAAILITTPILFAAMGELISQRAGVLNIGLEGVMLVGAFFAFWVAEASGSLWLGVGGGLLAGVSLAVLMAALSIEAHAGQVIAGLGVLILGFGVAAFAFQAAFAGRSQVLLSPMQRHEIPGLSSVPAIGSALFDQIPLVYIAFLLVPAVAVLLYRTSWGIAIRAAGDLPIAAEASGLSVRKIRWLSALAAGALAGVGGTFLSIGEVGTYVNQMTGGRGFLAIAAVIFGAWRPFRTLGACFLFGGVEALQLRLQGRPFVPREVWAAVAVLVLAYAVTVLVQWLRKRDAARPSASGAVLVVVLIGGGAALAAIRPAFEIPSELWLAMPFVITIAAPREPARP